MIRRSSSLGRTTTWLAAAALPFALALPGCGTKRHELQPGPPVAIVTMREYRFDHAPSITAGRVIFRIPNAGLEPHRLALAAVPDGLDAALEQLRGGNRPTAIAAIPNQAPGMTGTFAVDLAPGRYGLFCLVSDASGNHALRGMASELEVR